MMTIAMANLFAAPERQRPPAAPGRSPGDGPQALRSLPAPGGPRRTPVHPARRIVVGVLTGALIMLCVATLDRFGNTTVPVLGSFAALPVPEPTEAERLAEIPPPPTTPGTCLNWNRPDAADTTVVDCAQPHLFEQAGTVQLATQTTLPDAGGWRALVNEQCTPVVLSYLDGRYDPTGRFRVGALKPAPSKWADGDRELRCGLQSASRSGALYPITGKVAAQDQSAVHEPGTCLAIDGRTIGDPVSCAGPHAVETVGIVDLSTKFPDAFPTVADQDAFLQPACTRIAGEYAGSPEVISKKKLTVYWDNLTEESWKAGTRRVNCNLAALLPDRSGFAPVTGPVKGDVTVGEEPAPPATNTPQPGVPASTAPAPVEPTVEPTPAPPGPSSPPASQPSSNPLATSALPEPVPGVPVRGAS
ncbi:septum formation family protein [Pseudonocardia hispaniensis]|uniref:Septum formation family protein n=1 Tax=Pseudonocardia hispaniensis TaxID=904933 RepID=A0ABW1J5S8_9PSEU